ncbi:MAG: DoxX family protein [Chloroflexi bacterium]|nr:DoxX family protein [Chloroflexota bacterium]
MNVRTLPTAWGITVVRVMAGIIIFWAGVEKFQAGNFGQSPTLAAFPVPAFWGTFIPLLETVGGLLLLLGLGARWVAILFVIEYFGTGPWIKSHAAPPFGGWDSMRIDLMLMATALALVLVGPGAFALETLLFNRGRPQVAATEAAVSN